MSGPTNIQVLFSRLRLHHIRAYLEQRGWEMLPEMRGERVFFQGPIHDGGKPYEISIVSSETSPRFRSRIQNAVYVLSEIEDRHPVEIAGEMLAQAAVPVMELEKTVSSRLMIINTSGRPLTIRAPASAATDSLANGESLELRIEGCQGGLTRLEYGADLVEIVPSPGVGVKMYYSEASSQPTTSSLAEFVVSHLGQAGASETERQRIVDSLRPILKRAEFETLSAEASPILQANAALRQAAIIAVGLAHVIGQPSALNWNATPTIWRICAALLVRSAVKLERSESLIDELFAVAQADDELSPAGTLHWLRTHGDGICN